MGFVLVGTVVYLLTILEPHNVVPTVGLLFALWFACWWIGRLSPTADPWRQFRAWALAIAFCLVVWLLMFPGIRGGQATSFPYAGLAKVMQQRLGTDPAATAADADAGNEPAIVGPNTVLVDFTADWCVTCKEREANVLHAGPVVAELQRLGVVLLKADWTHRAKAVEVTRMLDVLGSRQVPVIAIFSAADPNHPSVFRGWYTADDILKALEKAGPSPRPAAR
jgi:thiol:disulfide interchange protein